MGSLATRVHQQLLDLRKLHEIQQQQADTLRSTYVHKNQHIVTTKLQSNAQCPHRQFQQLLDTITSYTRKIRSVEWDARRMFPVPEPPPSVFSQFNKEFTGTLLSDLDFRSLLHKRRATPKLDVAAVYKAMIRRLQLTYGREAQMRVLQDKQVNETTVRRVVDIWLDALAEMIEDCTIHCEYSTHMFDQTEESGICNGRYDYLLQKNGVPRCIIETKNGFAENMDTGQSQLLISMIDLQLRLPDSPNIVGILTTGYQVRILDLRRYHVYTSRNFTLKCADELDQMLAMVFELINT